MKKIAVDLDGVIFDSETLYRVYSEMFDVEQFGKDNLVNNSKRKFQDRYNWSQEESINFYKKYSKKILKNAKLMEGVRIVLPKLMKYFQIVYITSRTKEEVGYIKKQYKFLKLNEIKIFENENNKIDRYIKEKVDYVIDDDEEICKLSARNNIQTFYFKNNAANVIHNQYIVNINNWGELYKYLYINDIKK
ncbi:MAG: hypothetical protein E7166_05435 [Firmicutes bacterium]|nr:hypothetical protein [Bacillota bacterium]